MTRSGNRAQGIAQFMPNTAAKRGLLDPFNPQTALPRAAEFLAELRSEFGNLGLAAAAYNAGSGRVRNFIGRRGGLPAQTRNYVRTITGRSVDEWAQLGREGGKSGIAPPTSCRQLAMLLKEQPSLVIGKVEHTGRVTTSARQGIPDRPNTFTGQDERISADLIAGVTARNRNSLQAHVGLLPTPEVPIPKPSPSAARAEFKPIRFDSEIRAVDRRGMAIDVRSFDVVELGASLGPVTRAFVGGGHESH